MTSIQDCIINMHPLMKKFKDTVESMWSEGLSHRLPLPPEDRLRKSDKKATRYRNLGNEDYRQKKMDDAMIFFTKSVAHAPNDSLELRLAYGNRSAVNLFREKYTLCLLDVNRALSGPLPENTKQTLLKRKKDCLRKLREQNTVKSNMKKAFRSSAKNGMRALTATERRWLYDHQMSKDESDYKIDFASFDDPIWSKSFDNASVPGVTPKVQFSHDLVHGRHLVARTDIEPGEVISVQEIFEIVTNMSTKLQYCSYCTLWCEALIPCLTCTVEMYCSESCRTKAYDSYHRTECKVISSIVDDHDPDLAEKWLPLRIFLKGTRQGATLMELMLDPNVVDILRGERESVAVQYPTNDYFAILSLTWNIDKKIPPPHLPGGDHFLKDSETFKSVTHLFELLQHVNYFNIEHEPTENRHLTDPELFAGLLLLHHIAVTKRYKFMSDVNIVSLPNDFVVAENTRVGTCVGAVTHFMNHSCNANTVTAVDRRRLMILSLRLIKTGEQVFTTYYDFLTYLYIRKSTREKLLASNFNTVCNCRACVEQWPEEVFSNQKNIKYITKDKALIQKIKETHDWFDEIFRSDHTLDCKYNEADLQRALRFNKSIRQHVKEPSVTIGRCEIFIERLMKKRGNRYDNRKFPSTFKPGDELGDFMLYD